MSHIEPNDESNDVAITLSINGRVVKERVPPRLTLLRFLRDRLRLTGTKNGCSQGDCGSCTVLVDGKPEKSCLLKMRDLNRCSVVTIEGLARDDALHPIQQSFVDVGAIQCGFCSPGMIMRAKALLDAVPNPSRSEIVAHMGSNLCRCTGYVAIIEALERAAALLRGEDPPPPNFPKSRVGTGVVGSVPREAELELKAAGKLTFADDMYPEGTLYGRLCLTPYPHAEILAVDLADASAIPGVRYVLTHRDVPGTNRIGRLLADQPVLAEDRAHFAGDVVALVLADDAETASLAARRIRVEYRKLPLVRSPQEGLKPEAPALHEKGNVIKHIRYQTGDVIGAFAAADVVIEQDYQTQALDHAYMEPEAGVAQPTPDGGVTLWCPNQMPFFAQRQVAANLGLPVEKIRFISTPQGGGFGGKIDEELPVLLALGAFISQRPVKITLTRAESMKMHSKRHAYWLRYKTAAYKDGRLAAVQAELISDAGPYCGLSPAVLEQSTIFACGPYVWPNVSLESKTVRTNNAPGGAFRGFGSNQAHFAIESQMDMMARALALDPLEFRLQNALAKGRQTALGEILRAEVGISETLRRAKPIVRSMAAIRSPAPAKRIGIGVAAGYKNVGLGKGFQDFGGARMRLLPEGRVLLAASAIDMGQGVNTVLRQIASETSGVPTDAIDVLIGDTGAVPDGAIAVSQRQTYVAGNATLRAAERFKTRILEIASQMLEIPTEILRVAPTGVESLEGNLRASWSQLGEWAARQGEGVESEYNYLAPPTFPIMQDRQPVYAVGKGGEDGRYDASEYRNYFTYTFMTQIAVVEVDEATGAVKVLKIVTIPDVGRILNPRVLKGQLEGSTVMGVGYALTENFRLKDCVPVTTTLRSYGTPTFADTPAVEIDVVEIPEEGGPFGARAVSEVALVPTVPAITNAIYDAVGVRITRLPVDPESIRQALSRAQQEP